MVTKVEAQLGSVNFLVNNAGTSDVIGPIWETDPDDWWREVEVNLRGPLLCSWAVLPGMIARHHGRIVNMSSGLVLNAGKRGLMAAYRFAPKIWDPASP
jgi:NAD(P)-dependent dehydrogenase (short-subunit alcohol dehydrogenase family)